MIAISIYTFILIFKIDLIFNIYEEGRILLDDTIDIENIIEDITDVLTLLLYLYI